MRPPPPGKAYYKVSTYDFLKSLKVGDKVRFEGEVKRYTVQARNERFLICTKPHRKTVIYTIVDQEELIRGAENLIFGYGFETPGQCADALVRLTSGETQISHRNQVPVVLSRGYPE